MASYSPFGSQSLVPNYHSDLPSRDRPDIQPPPQKKAKAYSDLIPKARRIPVYVMLSRLADEEDPDDIISIPMDGYNEWEKHYHEIESPVHVPKKDINYNFEEHNKRLLKSLKDRGIPVKTLTAADMIPDKKVLPHEMSDDELWRYGCLESDHGAVDIEPYRHEFPKFRRYLKQFHESDGFDIDEMPNIGISNSGPLKVDPHGFGDRFIKLAQYALDEAFNNNTSDNNFKVSQVKSVTVTVGIQIIYAITFIGASDVDSAFKTFQAKVRTWKPIAYKEKRKTVLLCRIKG